tara:strand:- start:16274 stop:17563 length:1290 start_codon:yes stop_codon:yes gene_type:complete
MKRQLLPLLLCIFVVLFAFNNASYAINNLQQNEINSSDYQHFDYLHQVNPNFNFNEFNSAIFFTNNININDVFSYYSESSNFGGISTLKEISYKYIDKKEFGSQNILTPIQYQGNLFNQGLFYGFALTIILLNLVCFFVFDEIIFVKFSATVAALTFTLFFAEGLFPLIGIDVLLQNYMMQSTLLLITIGFHSLFTDKYLSIKEYYPKLSQISLAAFGVAFLFLITSWINGNSELTSIVNIILFGVLGIYFIAGVLLFSKNNYAKFYVIGTFIPLLFSIDYFLLKPLGIEFLFTEVIHLKVATLFEVLLLSYAIMYRMQAVKEEGELRQTEMRIYLKRQDVMTRNQVEQLVEDVYLENLIMQYDLDGIEIKLLQYISEGKENTKIARKLKLTEVEVVDYTKDLYKKLEISEHIQEDYRLLDNQPDYIYN